MSSTMLKASWQVSAGLIPRVPMDGVGGTVVYTSEDYARDGGTQERTQAKAENYCLLYSGDFLKTVNWPQKMLNL